MNAAVVVIAIVALLVGRIALRRWAVRRWLDGRIGGRRAAYLFFLITYGPFVLLLMWLALRGPTALLLALLLLPPLLFYLIAFDYAERHGVREHLLRMRDKAKDR